MHGVRGCLGAFLYYVNGVCTFADCGEGVVGCNIDGGMEGKQQAIAKEVSVVLEI